MCTFADANNMAIASVCYTSCSDSEAEEEDTNFGKVMTSAKRLDVTLRYVVSGMAVMLSFVLFERVMV